MTYSLALLASETDVWIQREPIFSAVPRGGLQEVLELQEGLSTALHPSWCAGARQVDKVASKAPAAAARRVTDQRQLFSHRSASRISLWSRSSAGAPHARARSWLLSILSVRKVLATWWASAVRCVLMLADKHANREQVRGG